MLSATIDYPYLNFDIMQMWNNVVPIIKDTATLYEHDISAADAAKYKFDLFTIFTKVLEDPIPLDYVYPNMLLNGYTSFIDYDGKKTKFYSFSKAELEVILTAYKSQKQ